MRLLYTQQKEGLLEKNLKTLYMSECSIKKKPTNLAHLNWSKEDTYTQTLACLKDIIGNDKAMLSHNEK